MNDYTDHTTYGQLIDNESRNYERQYVGAQAAGSARPGDQFPNGHVFTPQSVYGTATRRFFAFIVDAVITQIPLFLVLGTAAFQDNVESNIGSAIIGFFYWTLQESSSFQATIGQRWLNLKVEDLDGNRISFGRAAGRYLATILSAFILMIGFIMIIFTKKKQGLHDIIAGTLVKVRD